MSTNDAELNTEDDKEQSDSKEPVPTDSSITGNVIDHNVVSKIEAEFKPNVENKTPEKPQDDEVKESQETGVVDENAAKDENVNDGDNNASKNANSDDSFKIPKAPAETTAEASSDHAEQHVTYNEDGTAIYTDPNTKHKYRWCEKTNNWVALLESTAAEDRNENPYENEHYKWCSETQRWILKETQPIETEFYKWDAEKNEWIQKPQQQAITNDATGKAAQTNVEEKTYDIDEHGQRIYTDKDGAVFFWDEEKNAWFPKIDDDFMARYQMSYGFIDNVSAGEEEKRKKAEAEAKRKAEELAHMAEEARAAMENSAAANSSGAAGGKRKSQEPPRWFDIDPEHNTKVYVSNLPLDITIDEFAELMSKCGMIMRDQQTQKYKLKLYTEADGQIKGDGLCDYIKVESVNLALKILDDYVYRGNKIHVQRAEFHMRGEYNPALKPKRKKKDKEKLKKLKERLFDWRPDKMRGERSKNEKVVIIKNLFTPEIFEKNIQLILDYQNDLREECSKCGTVRKVIIYDLHPEGVAQVNMASPEEADLVIQMMQGRFFGKRQLSAEHWDGKTKYKIGETEKEAQERLTNWDDFLETADEKEHKEKETLSDNESADTAAC